jgi:hypothetical protein
VWYRAIYNQDGKVVQDGHMVTLVECRPLVREEMEDGLALTAKG